MWSSSLKRVTVLHFSSWPLLPRHSPCILSSRFAASYSPWRVIGDAVMESVQYLKYCRRAAQ